MQELIKIYNTNLEDIERFLIDTVDNYGNLEIKETNYFKKFFMFLPSLELIYVCEKDNLIQISENIYKRKRTKNQIGISRKYILKKLVFYDNGIAISKPYISSATGNTCVTVSKKEKNKIYFLDFNLNILLKRLGFIEMQEEFNFINKSFYFTATFVMIILAMFTVGYSIFEFINSVFIKSILSIESIFKPVIALTLGLAIFDLAKTILEQEVVFKSYSKNSKKEYKVLTKFSITIIIALLIESLMVVFKIAIDDYSLMIHAVYLIISVAILVVALGLFILFTKKN